MISETSSNGAGKSGCHNEGTAMGTILTNRVGVPAFPFDELAGTASHTHHTSLQVHRGLELLELRGWEVPEGDLS